MHVNAKPRRPTSPAAPGGAPGHLGTPTHIACRPWTPLFTFEMPNPRLQDLLGSSFRQQAMMDGHFDNISFVCTKCDNIEVRCGHR